MSLEEVCYWQYARPSIAKKMPPGSAIGKWCIFFLQLKDVDEIWPRVAVSAEAGRFWRGVFMTPICNPRADPDEFVICVFTHNCMYETDVMRVREELRRIGITQPLGYIADADSVAGSWGWLYADEGWTRCTSRRAQKSDDSLGSPHLWVAHES